MDISQFKEFIRSQYTLKQENLDSLKNASPSYQLDWKLRENRHNIASSLRNHLLKWRNSFAEILSQFLNVKNILTSAFNPYV